MMIDLTDTSTHAVRDALTRARDQMGGPTTGMVLNLIIMTDESAQYDAVRAATQAGREHPCRVLGVIARNPDAESRLDAEIRTGEGAPGQTVLLRMYGPMGLHADSVVTPLLVPDTPVVTWWPRNGPAAPSGDPLGMLAQRRVTDAASAPDPAEALVALAVGYRPGDTDLSWTRATPWRSLLAATLDQPHGEITGGSVTAEPREPERGPDRGLALGPARRAVHPRRSPAGPASPRCGSPPPTATSRSPGRTGGPPPSAGRTSPTGGSRCTAGTPPNCWPRSCAGSIPTRCTARR